MGDRMIQVNILGEQKEYPYGTTYGKNCTGISE